MRSLSSNNSGQLRQVIHTHVSVTMQCNFVLAKGRRRSVAGKVWTLKAHSLISPLTFNCNIHHKLNGPSSYGLSGLEREMSTSPMLWRGMLPFTLPNSL